MNSLALRKVYQRTDAETMLHVALGRGELREKQGWAHSFLHKTLHSTV